MKKIFSIALAATLLAAGCQKTEVIGTSTTGSKMTFSTEMQKITKAGEGTDETPYTGELPDGNANLRANGFRVWAYANYDTDVNSNNVDTSTGIYDGMSGDLIKYNSGAWEHFDNKEYYWPAEKRNLMFFAVSAQEGTTLNTVPISGIKSPYPSASLKEDFVDASLSINDFIVSNIATPAIPATANESAKPAIPVASNDLMIADFRNQNSGQNGKAVNLNFNHALTKVQFVFSTAINPYYTADDPEVKNKTAEVGQIKDPEDAARVFVQKVEVDGLFNMGTLTVTPTSGTVTKETGDDADISPILLKWKEPLSSNYTAGNTAFTATWPVPEINFPEEFEAEGANGEMTKVTKDEQKESLLLTNSPKTFATWFMLPQNLEDKMVKITYIINKRQFSAMFPLEGSTGNKISAWGVNQYVKYNIRLTPDMILFDADVDPWLPNNQGDPGTSLQK